MHDKGFHGITKDADAEKRTSILETHLTEGNRFDTPVVKQTPGSGLEAVG